MTPGALLHLLQLASPALPIGAYSYSQGLETAIELGQVHDAATARQWIAAHLGQVGAQWDGPMLWRLLCASADGDAARLAQWSERYLASRDTSELRAETVQMGFSLTNLLRELGLPAPDAGASLPQAYACATAALGIAPDAALVAALFSSVENLVLVCVKSIPLGQVAGQRLLLSLRADIEAAAQTAQTLDDDELCNWTPALSLLSMQHEVQHGRLYRS